MVGASIAAYRPAVVAPSGAGEQPGAVIASPGLAQPRWSAGDEAEILVGAAGNAPPFGAGARFDRAEARGDLDARADQYSLAALSYLLLTGRPAAGVEVRIEHGGREVLAYAVLHDLDRARIDVAPAVLLTQALDVPDLLQASAALPPDRGDHPQA